MGISQKYQTIINQEILDELIELIINRPAREQEYDIKLLEVQDCIYILEKVNKEIAQKQDEEMYKLATLIYNITIKRIKKIMNNNCYSKADRNYIVSLYAKLLNNNPRMQKYNNQPKKVETSSYKKKTKKY